MPGTQTLVFNIRGFFFICILYVGIDIIHHIWYNGTQYHVNHGTSVRLIRLDGRKIYEWLT